MEDDYYGFYEDGETGHSHQARDEKEPHVLTELIALIRSALNILEVIYSHYNKKRKE